MTPSPAARTPVSRLARANADETEEPWHLVGFALVTPVGTRGRACENRKLARSEGDPLAAKRRAKPPTFRQGASRTCDALRPRWNER